MASSTKKALALEHVKDLPGACCRKNEEFIEIHNCVKADYPKELEARINQFTDGGWIEKRSRYANVPPLP